jgi:uncharacterized membrane protein
VLRERYRLAWALLLKKNTTSPGVEVKHAMAVDIHTQTQQERAEVDRTLGGNLFVWFGGLALGLGLFLLAVGLAPGIGGFALMALSGVLAGLSYAELMLRMPSVTHRFTF